MLTGSNLIGYTPSKENDIKFSRQIKIQEQIISSDFHEASAEEVDKAVNKASKAFLQYRLLPGKQKAGFLLKIAKAIEAAKDELLSIAQQLTGQLTVSIWATDKDLEEYSELISILELKVGRIIYNTVPTGVEVTYAMIHGGPFPATTDSKFTSVGTNAIYRFTRPVSYQSIPQKYLPAELKDENPLSIWRIVNSAYTNAAINS